MAGFTVTVHDMIDELYRTGASFTDVVDVFASDTYDSYDTFSYEEE